MTNGRGYLIPEVVDPGVYRCIRVFIPDDDMYLYAFMGAYEYFMRWVAWEKDGTTRATEAAQVWATAYEMTRDSLDIGCLEMEELQQLIDSCCEKIGDGLALIANQINKVASRPCGSAGGGCIPVGDNIEDAPPESYDPENDVFPPDFENEPDPSAAYYEDKCKWANAMADTLIGVIQKMSDAGFALAVSLGAAAVVTIISLLVPGVLVLTAAATVLLVGSIIALGSLSYWTWEIFAGIANELLISRGDLVCALYNSESTGVAKTAVRQIFYSAVDNAIESYTQVQKDEMRPDLVTIVDAYINNYTVNLMFKKFLAGEFDGDYSNVDCSSCTEVPFESDYEYLEIFPGNDILPFTGGNGIEIHIDAFYEGDGHIAMTPTPATSVSVNATSNQICAEAGLTSPLTKVLTRIDVYVAHATQHGQTPSQNDIEVICNEGQIDEETFTASSAEISDDVYTVLTFEGAFPWSYASPQNAVKIRCNFGGTFNAETKIGAVKFYMDEA